MLGRRGRRPFRHRLQELVWPRAGWRRSGTYMLHRFGRLPGTPYSLAAGFACGAAVSCLPFIGFHFLLGGLLAFGMRASIIASAIGTVIGNPWTFPFIWVTSYRIGRSIGFGGGAGEASRIDFHGILTAGLQAVFELDMGHLVEVAWPVVKPMIAGGAVLGIVCWVVFYAILYPVSSAYQSRRSGRLQRGRERQAARRTRGDGEVSPNGKVEVP